MLTFIDDYSVFFCEKKSDVFDESVMLHQKKEPSNSSDTSVKNSSEQMENTSCSPQSSYLLQRMQKNHQENSIAKNKTPR